MTLLIEVRKFCISVRVFIFVLALLTTNGDANAQIKNAKTDTNQIVFSDHPRSLIQIFKEGNGENIGWCCKSTEIHYKIIFRCGNPFGKLFNDVSLDETGCGYYLTKFTTTTTEHQGSENVEKKIKVEITPLYEPHHKPLVFYRECEDLFLENDYYKTVNYGCCGGDDEFSIYDFQNNLLINGDVKIVLATIPNSKIKFFTAYKSSDNDTSYLGTLFLCYNNKEKYQIKINKPQLLPSDCEYRVPELFIYSRDSRDVLRKKENEYELWSLNNSDSIKEIKDISVKLAFECNAYDKHDTLEMPIIEGRPFGNSSKNQNYNFTRK